jgi:hypothetical protein
MVPAAAIGFSISTVESFTVVVPARLTDELHSSADLPAVKTFSLFVRGKEETHCVGKKTAIFKSFIFLFPLLFFVFCLCVCVRDLVFVRQTSNGDRIDPPLNWEDVVDWEDAK